MSTLFISDIYKIYHNFEPSRLKLWEIVRTYDPIQFTKLLFLLENVHRENKRETYTLSEQDLITFCNYHVDRCTKDLQFDIDTKTRVVRLERVRIDSGPVKTLFNETPSSSNPYDRLRHRSDVGIDLITNLIRITSPEILGCTYFNLNGNLDENLNNDDENPLTSIYVKVMIHNIGTKSYSNLMTSLNYLLLPEMLQHDRNNAAVSLHTSVASKYLQFYNMLNCYAFQDFDPRRFRSMVMPRCRRIYERLMTTDEMIVQPLYQGFYIIVYANKNETRIYNRYGELMTGLGYSIQIETSCTFIGILLPVDEWGNVRSWRYWPYRKTHRIYMVDILRYEQTMLINEPFKERLKYVSSLLGRQRQNENDDSIICAIDSTMSWSDIENSYIENRDVYDPIIGVVVRNANDLVNVTPLEYRFNIKYGFDLRSMNVIDLTKLSSTIKSKKQKIKLNTFEIHITCEMADFRTICIAYGHTEKEIYLCEYNRQLHQFVHAATLKRIPYDNDSFKYKSDNIYVINNKIIPIGIMYLRIYYDLNRKIIAYEQKMTDSKFDNPYINPLLTSESA